MTDTEIWVAIIKEDMKHIQETGWSYFEEQKKDDEPKTAIKKEWEDSK